MKWLMVPCRLSMTRLKTDSMPKRLSWPSLWGNENSFFLGGQGMSNLDLSTEISGVKFKNPVLPGAGEIAEDVRGVRRMLSAGVGGIVSKSYTSMRLQVRRPRPNNFMLRGKGFMQSGSFLNYSTSHPQTIDIMLKTEIPKMVEECKKAD